MHSAVTSTSSLNSTHHHRRKISEFTEPATPTEALYRKWSHIGTPPRSSTSTTISAGIAPRGTFPSLSMSAKDRARKFSERIASWVSMSICE
uniref:Uncharacterized protein n=1 Tax=Caenorhabditis japonica TaxID=281687 RepID=A0A8R1HNY2_CAEJA